MKLLGLVVAALVSTPAFASDIDGSWQMSQISCSGGSKLELGGIVMSMVVAPETIRVAMTISEIPGCELHQISTYSAANGKLKIQPTSSGATQSCGEEFTIDMAPSAFDYVINGNTLNLSAVSIGDGGCPAGEIETTVLTRK